MINYALEFVLYLLRITLGEPLWNNTSSVLCSRRRAVVAIKSRILYSRLLPVVPHFSLAFSIPPFTRCHSRIPHSRFLPIAPKLGLGFRLRLRVRVGLGFRVRFSANRDWTYRIYYFSVKPVISIRRYWVKCGMLKVKCGVENAEWRWLVDASNHVTTHFADYHTNLSTSNAKNANNVARICFLTMSAIYSIYQEQI